MFRKILMMRFLKVIVLGFLINLCAVSAHAEVKKSRAIRLIGSQ